MLIHLTGRHIEITPALREHVEGKLSKLGRLLGDGAEAFAILSVEKHRHLAEIQLKTRSAVFAGRRRPPICTCPSTRSSTSSSGRSAGPRTSERPAGAKRSRPARRSPRSSRPTARAWSGDARRSRPPQASAVARADTGPAPRIVKVRSYRLKPLSPEDAVLELEGSGRDVLVFRDPETGRLGVLYRMKDGAYGHIDAKL